jgi:methylisocitrate lyase
LLDRAELGAMGYRMVLYPVSGLRAALAATRAVLEDLWGKGHQRDRVDQMLTRRELYDLLDYDGYDARDRAYFG